MGKTYFVYIMSNKSRRLYLGITSEFHVRVFKHKKQMVRRVVYRTLPVCQSAEWLEHESWKAIREAKFRPVFRRQPRKS